MRDKNNCFTKEDGQNRLLFLLGSPSNLVVPYSLSSPIRGMLSSRRLPNRPIAPNQKFRRLGGIILLVYAHHCLTRNSAISARLCGHSRDIQFTGIQPGGKDVADACTSVWSRLQGRKAANRTENSQSFRQRFARQSCFNNLISRFMFS